MGTGVSKDRREGLSQPSTARSCTWFLKWVNFLFVSTNRNEKEMKMETVALNDQERRVFKRVAQTRLARVSEISRDLNIDTSTTLTILRALKGHSLVAEERSGSEMLSVYYLTTDGLAEARKLF